MSGCPDKRFRDMPWAYEVGLLDDDDRRAFELHIIECPHCRQDLLQFSTAAGIIDRDAEIRLKIRQLAEEEASPILSVTKQKPTLFGLRQPAYLPLALGTIALLLVFLLKPWQIQIRPTQVARAVENRLAIMYFHNMANEADPQQLGDIVTNLLITDLSESAYLEVVSGQRLYDILKILGTTGERRIDRDIAQQVADSTRAELMIMGSILQTDPYFVLTAQLIERTTGEVIAAPKITGTSGEDIFSIVDRLSAAIKGDLTLPVAAGLELDSRVADVTTHSPEAYRQYLEGVESQQKLYGSEARGHFLRAVELDSTFAMAYYYLSELGDPDMILKAEEFIDRATRCDRYYIRSRKAALDGNSAAAIDELQNLLARYPEEKRAHYQLGAHYEVVGNNELALKHLQQAIAIDPMYRLAVNYLAYFYDRIGDYEQAILTIDSYIRLAPSEPNPYDSRGDIYARNGKINLALASFKMALTKDPNFPASINNLAYLYCLKQQYIQADSLNQILAACADADIRTLGRLNLQFSTVQQGQFALALNNLDEGIQADLADGHNTIYTGQKHLLKSRIYAELGDFENAKSELRKHMENLYELYPKSRTHDRHYLAQLLAEGGDPAAAEKLALELKTDLEARAIGLDYYWYAAGCIALAQGNPELALEYLGRISEEACGFTGQFMLGQAYLKAGRLAEAVAVFEPLLTKLTISPAYHSIWNVKVHYFLGLAYEKSNWRDKAIDQYKTFLNIWRNADPGLPLVDDARARVARLEAQS